MSTSLPETPQEPARGRLARMPRVVMLLVLAIALAHAATYLLDARTLNGLIETFGVVPARFADGDLGVGGALAALTGNAFLHAGLLHLFFNCMLILQTGELVAERFGRSIDGVWRFLALFFGAAAAGAIVYVLVNWGSTTPAIGASGAACGLFAAYLMAPFPDWRVALRSGTVLQMGFVFLLVNVALAALARVTGALPIAWEAHLGGFIAGVALYQLLVPQPRGVL
jgi:membrane associated rhomboid family serine protease